MGIEIGSVVYEQIMITNTRREGTIYKTFLYRVVNMKDPNNYRCFNFSTGVDCMVGRKHLKPYWIQQDEFVEILLGFTWTKARAGNFLQEHSGEISVTFDSMTSRTITIPASEFPQRVRLLDKQVFEF